MKGSEAKMTAFMEGADKRYIIPVYQRKYDWKQENCAQLYEDLKKIIQDKRDNHFFGSIVSSVIPNGNKVEYHIIDGQQRLTTVTLLLLAISNIIGQGKISSKQEKLNEQIKQRFLISPWASDGDKIKLKPVENDRNSLSKLFCEEEDYDQASNLTLNYRFFYEQLLKEEVTIDDLYNAIGKLEIISITLEPGDNAQLIFESLNSTGLALTEGDKIRNYILMGQPAKEQSRFYNTYWLTIEKCTKNDVSGFVRDYLSIKQLVTPNISNVYRAFKEYAANTHESIESLLEDLRKYARFYEKLLNCQSGLKSQKLDDCLYRMMRLEITVTRPFLMEVFRLNQEGRISTDDVLQTFEITENYLFRRNICEVPTNALNKIFVNLNREILRYDNTANNYVPKLIYALVTKKESGRFPDDKEFTETLAEKQIYLMRGKYKAYLFERFENYGTIETKDVYTHLDNNVYTIEHIMPQHLTPAWAAALGPNAVEIHHIWLHRLANLTLSGYNPSLSDKTFKEKRDAEESGYKASGLRMSQKIASKESWGLLELEERNKNMLDLAIKIWAYPKTSFEPLKKENDTCTLDDENIDLSGRAIVKYSYQNIERPVDSWRDMFEQIIRMLHSKDQSVLLNLAYNQNNCNELSPARKAALTRLAYGQNSTAYLARYITNTESSLRTPLKIANNIYIELNSNTSLKLTILRRLFQLYGADPMDLLFFLEDMEKSKNSETARFEIRRRYWEYALPIIQKQNMERETFNKCTPRISHYESGHFGISGFSINCVALYDMARVDLWFGNSVQAKNKSAFDCLYRHKTQIEKALDVLLNWERANDCKASSISISLSGVSIKNEADWPRMAKFHAEWSEKILNAVLPYLQDEEKSSQYRELF